ncbi:hypothetical protein H0A64_07110 [Alcaligenaceae bacterium]|nr:hypothetical protein [Alcaligenaceae bacterium]
MSGAATIAAVAAVASVGVAAYTGMEQKKAASRAADQAERSSAQQAKQAEDQAKRAEQDTNRVNQKRPDVKGILDAASQAGKAGASGTMLTGPQGVDPNALQLGKNTLLGG